MRPMSVCHELVIDKMMYFGRGAYPGREGYKEECPLLGVQHAHEFYRIRHIVHGRFE